MKAITRLSPLLLGLFSQILASAPLGQPQNSTESSAASAKEGSPDPSSSVVIEGVLIPKAKERFAQIVGPVKSVRQSQLLPLNFGGTTFMGLVGRLLGEAPNRHHEGILTRRNIYFAVGELSNRAVGELSNRAVGETSNRAVGESGNTPSGENSNVIGIAHGSKFEHGGNSPYEVVVFYTPGGTVLKVDVSPLPQPIADEFKKDNILGQFEGHTTESFEVIRGRRGKLVSKGLFLSKARRPRSAEGRAIFDKILRSVRFNAAFMDVAYFITQHPDRADIPLQEFPDQIEITKGMPQSGPEAFVKDKKLHSPIDGKGNLDDQESSSSRED